MLTSLIALVIFWACVIFVVRLIVRQVQGRQKRQSQSAGPSSTTPRTTATAHAPRNERLPVRTKQYFFSRSENTFFKVLTQTLEGTPYRIFPNVRLNDVFTIEAPKSERQAVYAKLRDKHVDFLIVMVENYRPVCAIELDGVSHETEIQQNRDGVKNLVFESAGLPLVRLDARTAHTTSTVMSLLRTYLPALRAPESAANSVVAEPAAQTPGRP